MGYLRSKWRFGGFGLGKFGFRDLGLGLGLVVRGSFGGKEKRQFRVEWIVLLLLIMSLWIMLCMGIAVEKELESRWMGF